MDEIAMFGEVHDESRESSKREQVHCVKCGWTGRRKYNQFKFRPPCPKCGETKIYYPTESEYYFTAAEEE